MHKSFFVNLPVTDLDKSKEYFKKIGFSFEASYTYENALCLVIGKNCYVMLFSQTVFKKYIVNDLCNTATHRESFICISKTKQSEVDDFVDKAIEAGGSEHSLILDKQDYNFVYSRGFCDLDGHLWMVVHFK
ncbi:VOC family protein [Fluviispira multicolorata]|uniref:Glyoxalase/bleomycin resistance/extradiol dioxygenase family protein n=1 Tax=Fluviispira multicolorata TaxID=2654512 RepID=A0A833JC70_9BACT|nr:glyoxalase/bleomycin resistance/extradiol dioxygenase family protein [Fluviispira multicolorata]KAB8029993.1 glyoxalase/bleomycin resistance/extradiol dioxygenase family protein [Fluviispira multicolorata]